MFSCVLFFNFVLDVLIAVYTPRVYLIEVKVKLTFTFVSLWTKYYFVTESINALYFVNPFTPTRYPTWLKKIQLAFCNPYGGVKTISKESFPYVV